MKRILTSKNGGECPNYLAKQIFGLDARWCFLREYLERIGLESKLEGPVLDIGCGAGSHVAALVKETKKKDVFGIDLINKQLLYGKKLYGRAGKFINGNIQHMPFKDESFTITHANEIYDNVAREFDRKILAKEIHRILKPGGIHIVNEGEFIIKSFYTKIGFNYIPPRLATLYSGKKMIFQKV
jgi:ubiquinone/menaquinone biosynthesis C-methylase UbiE